MSHVVILEKVEFKDRLNMYVHPDEFMKLFMPVALWSMLRVQVDLEPPNGTYPISNLRGQLKTKFTCSGMHLDEEERRWTAAKNPCDLNYQILRISGTQQEYVVRFELTTYKQKCRKDHGWIAGEAQLQSLVRLIHRFSDLVVSQKIERQVLVEMPTRVILSGEQERIAYERYLTSEVWNIEKIPKKGIKKLSGQIVMPWWDHHYLTAKVEQNELEKRKRLQLQPRNRPEFDGLVGHNPERCEACQLGRCKNISSDRPDQYQVRAIGGLSSKDLLGELLRNQRPPNDLRRSHRQNPQPSRNATVVDHIRASSNDYQGINPLLRVENRTLASFSKNNSFGYAPGPAIPLGNAFIKKQTVAPAYSSGPDGFLHESTFSIYEPMVIKKQADPQGPTLLFSGAAQRIGGTVERSKTNLYQAPLQQNNLEENLANAFIRVIDDYTKEKEELEIAMALSMQDVPQEQSRVQKPIVQSKPAPSPLQQQPRAKLFAQTQPRTNLSMNDSRNSSHTRPEDQYSDDYLFEDANLRPKPDSDYPDYYLFEGIENV